MFRKRSNNKSMSKIFTMSLAWCLRLVCNIYVWSKMSFSKQFIFGVAQNWKFLTYIRLLQIWQYLEQDKTSRVRFKERRGFCKTRVFGARVLHSCIDKNKLVQKLETERFLYTNVFYCFCDFMMHEQEIFKNLVSKALVWLARV